MTKNPQKIKEYTEQISVRQNPKMKLQKGITNCHPERASQQSFIKYSQLKDKFIIGDEMHKLCAKLQLFLNINRFSKKI